MATTQTLPLPKESSNPSLLSKREKAQALLARYHIDSNEIDLEAYDEPDKLQERVFKTIRIRVRYTCHKCSTSFGKNANCGGCQHKRCKLCIRYPLKKDKSKMPPVQMMDDLKLDDRKLSTAGHEPVCHECQTDIDEMVDECPTCQHKVCDRCVRETVVNAPTNDSKPEETVVSES